MNYALAPGQSITPQTVMLYDILAIQRLYGANMETRKGDTRYAYSATGQTLATIWDAGGVDTIDASNQSRAVVLNLAPGAFSSIGPSATGGAAASNLAIAFGVTIENAVGGSGSDRLTGNAVANRLEGGGGADTLAGGGGDDTLVGGSGTDVAVFARSMTDYAIARQADGSVRVSARAGTDGVDTLLGVERLRFSDREADAAAAGGATAQGSVSAAGSGASAPTPTPLPTAAPAPAPTSPPPTSPPAANAAPAAVDDGASVTAGATLVLDLLGNDRDPDGDPLSLVSLSRPTLGSVSLEGGRVVYVARAAGVDSFEYAVEDGRGGRDVAQVRITVADRIAVPDDPGRSIRGTLRADDIAGGAGADTIAGGGGADALRGLGGGDRIEGGGGDDTLDGGAGADSLIGGWGDDVLSGGAGDDQLVGGGGADRFDFRAPGGADVIADVDARADRILVAAARRGALDSDRDGQLDDGDAAVRATPDGLLIDFGGGATLLIEDRAAAPLDALLAA
jgi:Ca2+-binding RTX toxin-like protein